MDFLTDKQLRNLTTERLNALRKSVLKSRVSAQNNADGGSEADQRVANKYAEYYDLIKTVMEEREHIEGSNKPKQKGRDRDSIKRMTWE